jgi:hypothetical protein
MKHALGGFGGGPTDMPTCQACGAVLPEDANSGCTGPKLFDYQIEEWFVSYEVEGFGPQVVGPYELEVARSHADDIRGVLGVSNVELRDHA